MKQLFIVLLMVLAFPFYSIGYAIGLIKSAICGGYADAIYKVERG